MGRVVTIGGGMAGLATALFCARRGHEVVIIERDEAPPDGDADELAAWPRKGVAQAHHAHWFKARSTRVLREEARDLLTALADAGVEQSNLKFGTGFEDDHALDSRRPVYEGVMYRIVAEESAITFLPGLVRGLSVEGNQAEPRVTGVRLGDGTVVQGDLVVDAGGRRSGIDRWLQELGLDGLDVEDVPSNQHYQTRHYRWVPGAEGPSDLPNVTRLPYAVFPAFAGDNRTFSVAIALSVKDPLKKRTRDPDVYDRILQAIPPMAVWLEHAEPVSDVHVMPGVSNRRQRIAIDGRPKVTGIALVGDASLYTNPAHGYGVSLSFWMAQKVATAIEQFMSDPAGAVLAYQSWIDGTLGLWYEQQLAEDRTITGQFAAGLRGEGFIPPRDTQSRFDSAVLALSMEDEHLRDTVKRIGHLLELPSVIHEDPDVVSKVQAYLEKGGPPPDGEVALPRSDFESLVG